MNREQAEKATILRCVVGSTAHGLQVDDGVEDRDEMGVCVESMRDAMGFAPFEQFLYRTAEARRVEAGLPIKDERGFLPRSFAGDLDLTIYSLRKFCRLALQGNPTILLPLYAKPLMATSIGHQLQELAPAFASRDSGRRFLGYLSAQKQRLLGERGQKDVKRPELDAKYGFDVKYAYHMLRLGFQGIEFLETGRLSLPIAEPTRSYLLSVRTGGVPLNDVLTRCGELEAELRDLIGTSPLPEAPERDRVEQWMCRVYLEHWKATDDWHAEYPSLLKV